ncbi:MAG: hypothetical protein NDI87_09450, partial [Rhodoferax sp.]|nr:hypothetical protein [Rhodoferax sp.]
YCQHICYTKLPLQKFYGGNSKYLILLTVGGQKTGKTGFGVELGIPGHGPESTFGRERRSNPYVADAR